MKTRFLPASVLAFVFFFSFSFLKASEPEGYYRDAYGKGGYTLKTALHNIIKDHTVVSYSGLFDAYQKTDEKDGRIWDMYSNCNFSFSNRCGNYKDECDCYNREHSFPKSWFDDATPMYSDLFHLYPTDGKVNGMRSNYPFGEVGSPTYTSANGSKLGNNTTSGYSGKVFEPIDEYKGDFARSYFYMATRYEDKIASWSSCPICGGDNKASFKQWTIDLLLKWHRQDPVSQKEKDRNDAVYNYQHNRNPFIDHPELVEKIWGNDNTVFDPEDPNPPVNPDDPDNPDNPDNPDDPDNPVATTTYEIWYEYHDAEGNLVEGSDNMITIQVPQSQSKAAEEETVLMDEDFSAVNESNVNTSTTASIENTGAEYVENFDGKVYLSGKSAVRLGAGSGQGSVIFKEFSVNGDFSVTVSGKGWSASENEFTLECAGCTPSSQKVSFTKNKDALSGIDAYEELAPLTLTANGTVQLTLSAAGKPRVLIDRVKVVGSNGGGENPDNPDNPDLTEAHSLKVLYPTAGDTVRKAAITARVAVVDTDGAEIARYTLKRVDLPDTGNYSFWAMLWKDEEELSEQSVAFVYALPKPGDSVISEPVETPVFEPDGGEVAKGAQVRISCATEDAAIYYTTNGSEPTDSDEQYLSPIVINQSVTIKAIAIKDDEKSDVAQASFSVKDDDPNVDMEMFTGAEFRMYPNPTSGHVVLEMTSDDNLVEIFSVKGTLVARHRHVGERFETKLSRTGAYFVRVTNIYGGAVRRLIVR